MSHQPDSDDQIKEPPGGLVGKYLYWLLGGLSAVLLFCMMALTFVDVIGRYFFNAPIPGGFEITELLLATLIFCGLPLVSIYGEHVTVDLFDHFIPSSVRHIREAIISVISGIILFVLSFTVWEKAVEAQGYGDVTAMLQIPIAPMVYFMSVMLALNGCIVLVMAWWSATGHDQPQKGH